MGYTSLPAMEPICKICSALFLIIFAALWLGNVQQPLDINVQHCFRLPDFSRRTGPWHSRIIDKNINNWEFPFGGNQIAFKTLLSCIKYKVKTLVCLDSSFLVHQSLFRSTITNINLVGSKFLRLQPIPLVAQF